MYAIKQVFIYKKSKISYFFVAFKQVYIYISKCATFFLYLYRFSILEYWLLFSLLSVG